MPIRDRLCVSLSAWMLPGHGVTLLWRPVTERSRKMHLDAGEIRRVHEAFDPPADLIEQRRAVYRIAIHLLSDSSSGDASADVLDNPKRMKASLRLTAYLRCRYDIPLGDVIGHSESLSSPYHRERVKALRDRTGADFARSAMRRYRRML